MATRTRNDPADVIGRVGSHWGWVLAFGIITLAIGVIALVWPGRILLVIAVLFGIQLVVLGIFRFVAAFGPAMSAGTRVLYALLGVLSLIIGLFAVRHVLITLLALVVLLGIFWIVSGTVELFSALSHKEMPHRWWSAIMGIISVLAGFVILVYPGISLFVLTLVLGIWLIFFGAMQIGLAFQIRR